MRFQWARAEGYGHMVRVMLVEAGLKARRPHLFLHRVNGILSLYILLDRGNDLVTLL